MHHNNTPASILEAPEAVAIWVHKHTAKNRAQRRHYYDPETGKRSFIHAQEEASNEQYRVPVNTNTQRIKTN